MDTAELAKHSDGVLFTNYLFYRCPIIYLTFYHTFILEFKIISNPFQSYWTYFLVFSNSLVKFSDIILLFVFKITTLTSDKMFIRYF